MNEAAFGEDELDLFGMTGTYNHNVDDKGRINFPAKLREQLGETFWIARGTSDKFLAVYSVEGWKDVLRQVRDLRGPQGEKLRRWICSGAVEVTPDKQGRILIPQALRKYAELERDVVIAGTGKKAEIWDSSKWQQSDEAFDPMASGQLDGLDL